jgi:hypothetical protein
VFRNESPHMRVERVVEEPVEEPPIRPGSIPDQMLELLRERPMRVVELARALGRTYGTTSYSMQRLRRRKLVKKDGRCHWRAA